MEIINHKDKYYLKTETGYREILASTDKSLIKCPNKSIEFGCCDKPEFCEVKQIITPEIPQSFIEKFVEKYNKGDIITEVMVEYILNNEDFDDIIEKVWDNDYKLKINVKDNTINIKPIKDSWSREEIVKLFNKMYATDIIDANVKKVDFDKWVEEHL